ncbi:unnamed protein product [Diatraea saccharalis]|uniref:Uncharacterized protein n=1 Tax=Diatraea saccharalis TaxID=40085 RepID=A0A9N9WHD3_9NEOP|nr:unnamed protein product [Diatraea saccharalis]
MSYGYDVYSTSTHIRDHSHISQQPSYEEYFDSSSYPYQTSYLGEDSRQWDSGGHIFYDDNYGLTPTEYENVVNKRRSSVVQLPQIPPKQLPPSSRYSDYNEMAPYRPRPRRTTASLPGIHRCFIQYDILLFFAIIKIKKFQYVIFFVD